MNRVTRQLVKLAEEQGWRVRFTRKNHVILYAPDGGPKVTLGGTPSDHRSTKNSVARCKAAGLEIPEGRGN